MRPAHPASALLATVALLAAAACATPRPPLTQVEAIAACYALVLAEEPDAQIDRSQTRAEEDEDGSWTITGEAGSVAFKCEVTPQGEVTRSPVGPA